MTTPTCPLLGTHRTTTGSAPEPITGWTRLCANQVAKVPLGPYGRSRNGCTIDTA